MTDVTNLAQADHKLSLWERRQQYEAWLASSKRTPRPAASRIDDLPTDSARPGRRATAAAEAAAGLLSPLPPSAMVRTDEGDSTKDLTDEARLGLAGVLVEKARAADPATAERIANAASALLGPMIRSDDDATEVKNKVLGQGDPKRGESPGTRSARRDEEPTDEKERGALDDDDKRRRDHHGKGRSTSRSTMTTAK